VLSTSISVFIIQNSKIFLPIVLFKVNVSVFQAATQLFWFTGRRRVGFICYCTVKLLQLLNIDRFNIVFKAA